LPAWAGRPDGVAITVRVTPRSSRDIFAAGTVDHFTARLTAPPVDGAANDALIAVVAKAFGVPKRAVSLLSGDTSRLKRLQISGDAALLAKIAASLYEATP